MEKQAGLYEFFRLKVQGVAGHEVAGGAFDLPLRRHMGAITVNVAENAQFDREFFQQGDKAVVAGL